MQRKVVNLAVLLALFLSDASFGQQKADERQPAFGPLTVSGRVTQPGDHYIITVGAELLQCDLVLGDDKGLADKVASLKGKWAQVKGELTPKTSPAVGFQLRVKDVAAGDGYDAIEGELQVSGVLTKESWPKPTIDPPSKLKGDAFIVNGLLRPTFLPVQFGDSAELAKKAEGLLGRRVLLTGQLKGHNLGLRGQTLVFTVKELTAGK